jgi:hypothetical protein
MAVVLTLIAVVITFQVFLMSRRYSHHLLEVENARRDLLDEVQAIRSNADRQASMIDELHLGFDVMTKLVQDGASLRQFESLSLTSGIDQDNVRIEREKLVSSLTSRESEIRIIALGGKNCSATLNGIARTFGDSSSIDFFDRFIAILEKRGQSERKIIEARAVTYARLVDEGRIG